MYKTYNIFKIIPNVWEVYILLLRYGCAWFSILYTLMRLFLIFVCSSRCTCSSRACPKTKCRIWTRRASGTGWGSSCNSCLHTTTRCGTVGGCRTKNAKSWGCSARRGNATPWDAAWPSSWSPTYLVRT